MFVAVDFTATAEAALRWVAEWQQAGACEITLGYVHCQPNERADLAMMDRLGLTGLTPQAREGLEHDLRAMASRLGVTATVRVELGTARVDAHLILMATEAGADVLVLGAHQWQNLERVWHASISRRCLRDAPMNLVCVPVPLAPKGAAAAIPTFSRVLVATDFSERAGHAIPYAYAALAREGGVCLLHIAKAGKADEKIELEALEAKLRALIPAEAEKRGVVTEVRIIESGDEGKTICEAAKRFCADLVCIGSHGHSGMAAALMGSVAQAVIAHSHSPVLLIRPPQ